MKTSENSASHSTLADRSHVPKVNHTLVRVDETISMKVVN